MRIVSGCSFLESIFGTNSWNDCKIATSLHLPSTLISLLRTQVSGFLHDIQRTSITSIQYKTLFAYQPYFRDKTDDANSSSFLTVLSIEYCR